MDFEERSTHVYRQKQMMSREELVARESLCVYEQPAYCVAACPLKLDTKALIRAIASADFNQARQLYEKITMFPHILSAGCDAPCQEKCKLGEVGDGVAVRQLEYAAVNYGEKSKAKGMFRFKKKQTVCILGSDLFTLFLVGELAQKNYPLTVFCSESSAEKFFLSCIRSQLEGGDSRKTFLLEDLKALKNLDIRFECGMEFTAPEAEKLRDRYDVTCISLTLAGELFGEVSHDEQLMMCFEKNMVMGGEQFSVRRAAFAAKKAALTVDRLAQKLSPDNSRGEEGSCETKLFTNLEDAKELRRVPVGEEGYSREEAVCEAGRCIQCHCDECIKGCAYLQHYKKFPRVLTREIYNNVSIIMGDHMMNKPINACSLCGQCTVTCPNGYDMAQICHAARENMVFTGKMPLAPHEFALHDMLFSNNEAFLCKKQPGFETCRYVFFPGCQAAAVSPETVKAAYLDLCSRLKGGVALMLGCCGAICDWAGRYEMYDDTKKFIEEKLKELGNPQIIAACPMCKKELSTHVEADIMGMWDILLEIGLPGKHIKYDSSYALHDSCGARGDAHTQEAIRKLLNQSGCKVIDTEYSGNRSPCCGYGGLTSYANREVAKKMTEKCLERSQLPYISYCMACRDRFAREGRESVHVLELIYGIVPGSPPDISEKRYNRLKLKNHLLELLWGEEIKPVELGFQLEYTKDALEMMDDRMILKSDVEAVMKSCHETGEALLDMETGLLVSRARLGNVTFWVKYTRTDNGYLVHRAYSHRMNVEKRMG
ncbi:MAG: 4Fe-4S dicluster domain-containing protein [Eubacteriales bacterium]|nr:4Fe-4S dicluster domain-containing protein [Eubacteriales bacterium]